MSRLDFEGAPNSWIDAIGNSESQALQALLQSGLDEDAVGEIWLSKIGAQTNAPFGGQVIPLGTKDNRGTFFQRLKQEFIGLICGDPKYEKERSTCIAVWQKGGQVGVLGAVSNYLGPVVGLAPVAIAPVIAILFSCANKISLNAYCPESPSWIDADFLALTDNQSSDKSTD